MECNTIVINAGEREKRHLDENRRRWKTVSEDMKNPFTRGLHGRPTEVGRVRCYMIRQIAEQYNAKIYVKGLEMVGARFDIYLSQKHYKNVGRETIGGR